MVFRFGTSRFVKLPVKCPQDLCVVPKVQHPAHFVDFFRKKPCNFSAIVLLLYPTRAGCWIHTSRCPCFSFCFHLLIFAIFFIYLLIIYPACPARDEKSDDPPARVVAFSFARRGQSTSRKSTAFQMTCRNCFSLSLPQKVCLNKHTCFFLTSLCMRVILISVN